MNFNKLSIKQLTTFLLLSLGAVVVVLSILAMKQLRDAALDAQARSLSQIIEVSVRKSMEELDSIANDLGVYTKKTKGFRSAVSQLIKNPGDSELTEQVSKLLDEQYHQRYVTSSIVDLRKIRLYNLNFQFIAQSNEGDRSLKARLPGSLLGKAWLRSGADRLKMLTSIWLNDGDALYSVLLPIGGLRQNGYMEIVLQPAHNLRSVEKITQLPLTISSVDGDVFYKSESWEDAAVATSLPIHYQMHTDDGGVAYNFEVLEDMKAFHEGMSQTQTTIIGSIVVVLGVFLFLSLWVLGKHLFRPAEQLVAAIEKCAKGDLSTVIEDKGVKELHTLSKALAVLVESLRKQVSVISKDSEHLAISATTLSNTIQSTEDALQHQQQETDQVAISINEMSASAVEVSKSAEHVAMAASDAEREALNGREVVGQTVDSINNLANEVELASEVMHNLKGESENIGTVLDVIKGIAEQTNLLALNAAIEAARAGEQGRGFAVVADEVRTLAGRTQQSTQEIQDMIESLQSGTHEAVSVMDKSRDMAKESVEFASEAGSYLDTITHSVGDISNMTTQIATASQQQSAVVEEINKSVVAITNLANKTSDDAQQVSSNSQQLTDMANTLKDLVKHFKV